MFFWSYAVLQILAGSHRSICSEEEAHGDRAVLLAAPGERGYGGATPGVLDGDMLLLGVFGIRDHAGAMRWIRYHVEEQRREASRSWAAMAGTRLGLAIGAPLAAVLLNHYGWRVTSPDPGLSAGCCG